MLTHISIGVPLLIMVIAVGIAHDQYGHKNL